MLDSGGTVLDSGPIPFSEHNASKYIGSLLSALHHMHSRNIVHRNICSKNLLIDSEDGDLKLIDFEHSKLVKDDHFYSDYVGSIPYVESQ